MKSLLSVGEQVILDTLRKISVTEGRSARIYLACPYTSKAPHSGAWEAVRFQLANIAAMAFIRQGAIVFSPLSHSHPIAMTQPATKNTHSLWLSQDLAFLDRSDVMIILDLPGARTSFGVGREIQFCEETQKPYFYTSLTEIYELENYREGDRQ